MVHDPAYRPRHRLVTATAPGLMLLPLVLPLSYPYKLYLEVLGIFLFVAIYTALGVRDYRALKHTRARQETEFKDFVRAQTADKP